MNQKYYNMPNAYPQGGNYSSGVNYDPNDERFIGPAFPFLLGGVTGAALAPAFWRPRPYPMPYPYYQPYPPMPYPPYYR